MHCSKVCLYSTGNSQTNHRILLSIFNYSLEYFTSNKHLLNAEQENQENMKNMFFCEEQSCLWLQLYFKRKWPQVDCKASFDKCVLPNSFSAQAPHLGELQKCQCILSRCKRDKDVPGQVKESFHCWENINSETKIFTRFQGSWFCM